MSFWMYCLVFWLNSDSSILHSSHSNAQLSMATTCRKRLLANVCKGWAHCANPFLVLIFAFLPLCAASISRKEAEV